MRDVLRLVDHAQTGGWELVCLDMADNSHTPAGTFRRMVVGAFTEMERALISERTSAALAAARSQGRRLGRPSQQPQQAKNLAVTLLADGCSLREIAGALTESGITTATGKTTWTHSSVQGLLRTAQLDREAEANAARYAAELHKR